MKYLIIAIVILFIWFLLEILLIRIILGYFPAEYDIKYINHEYRIYHNGLSESEVIDEHERTMTYYFPIPKSLIIFFWFYRDSNLDKFQKNANKRRNLK